MRLHEAVKALLDEYHLEDLVELARDDAKADPEFDGLSSDHPKVQRFHEVYRTLAQFASQGHE